MKVKLDAFVTSMGNSNPSGVFNDILKIVLLLLCTAYFLRRTDLE
jgi:hypothetical protein